MPEHDGTTEGFIAAWNLDENAADFLRSLDPAVQAIILTDFAPREETRDISGKFLAFAKSIFHTQQCDSSTEDFIQKWSLDLQAAAWLRGLPRDIADVLVREFEPNEDTQNIVGKLKGFARSIESRQRGVGGHGHQERQERNGSYQASRGAGDRSLYDFVRRWGAEESYDFLRELPVGVQRRVMEEFVPKKDTRDVNGKLRSFARSVASAWGDKEEIGDFVATWGLSEGSRKLLEDLPEDVLTTVLAEFEPNRNTANVDGKLRTFAQGILSKREGGLQSGLAAPVRSFATAGRVSEHPGITEFVSRWALDTEAIQLLESLPEGPLITVLEEFEPRAGTRNVGGKLRAFANTVLAAQGLPIERGLPPSTNVSHGEMNGRAEEEEFLARWGMSDNRAAQDVLDRLPPSVRTRVMQEFAPGPSTNDVFGKFCGFANSVARGKGADSGKGSRGLPPLGAPVRSESSRGLPPLGAPVRSTGGKGFGSSQNGNGRHADLDAFADRWDLDEGSRALLRGLDANTQARVVAEFKPHGDIRDMSGKFCSFARSLASAGPKPAALGSGKRVLLTPPWTPRRRTY
eukprot:TRINITY_DN49808_c0_g1_i1.p1 TRINITY_DN49808_c0_g1~~TRINITY_DN49808_c0_g1_i1.p1  ORF type:complete len:584 (+),score=123.06 TRINITY_DN49808_c0_g1_i1:32-1753(+)